MNFDYAFFEETLCRVRRLRSYTPPYYILDAAPEIATPEQLAVAPKVISISDDGDSYVFDTSSYSAGPGGALTELREFLGNDLSEDFLQFHRLHAEALVVTRSYPIHLWSEEKIIAESRDHWRSNFDKPIRFFRFGDHYDREATHFALWQRVTGAPWQVVSTAISCIDDNYDGLAEMDPDVVLASSFYEWLKDMVDRDGLPDPLIGVEAGGGFLDPVED